MHGRIRRTSSVAFNFDVLAYGETLVEVCIAIYTTHRGTAPSDFTNVIRVVVIGFRKKARREEGLELEPEAEEPLPALALALPLTASWRLCWFPTLALRRMLDPKTDLALEEMRMTWMAEMNFILGLRLIDRYRYLSMFEILIYETESMKFMLVLKTNSKIISKICRPTNLTTSPVFKRFGYRAR